MKWAPLESFWNRVINIGCHGDLSALELIRIRVVNGATLLLTFSQVVIVAMRIYYREVFEVTYIFNLLIALIIFPVIYFNRRGHYGVAKSLVFIVTLLLITFICWDHAVRGRDTNTELILLPCSIFCVLLFDRAAKYISFLAVFFCYMLVVVVRVQAQQGGLELTRDNFVNPILAFIIVFVLTSLYLMAYTRSQRMILAKNEELNRQKKQIEIQSNNLQLLNSQKDKLFSIISHDLRNPINAMNGLINLMAKDWITEQDFKHQLPAVSKSLMATSDLLNNLLFWSRSQMQGEVHHFSDFEISSLVTSVVTSLEGQSQQKGIRVENRVKEAVVHADQDMIAIVLRNLLTNAIKFSREGQVILILATSSEDLLEIGVEDSGTGIEPEELKNIFDFRFKTTRGTGNESGTGLGLTLCKDFVEKNGGRIWAQSEPGRGSTFRFTLPLKRQSRHGNGY